MKLFVGGLAWATTAETLQKLRSRLLDPVTEATVVSDRETGRSRGFGFVAFENADDGKKAMEAMEGAVLDGRNIRVSEAVQREGGARREGGFGGGSRGGFGGGAPRSGGGGFGGGDPVAASAAAASAAVVPAAAIAAASAAVGSSGGGGGGGFGGGRSGGGGGFGGGRSRWLARRLRRRRRVLRFLDLRVAEIEIWRSDRADPSGPALFVFLAFGKEPKA
jgi:cold-inducible RNA-binding protein